MKKLVLILPCLLFVASLIAQESNKTSTKSAVHHQLFKFGSSIQYEFSGYYHYDYYDDYYYHNYIDYNRAVLLENYDGPNTQIFMSYEHLWKYRSSMAIGIEPKLGISFREYQSNGFLGANWKFYWIDKDFWRMGIYLYTGYEYAQITRPAFISQGNGMYSKMIDRKFNQHVFSAELGFTPFQFSLKSTPIVIELNFCIIGLHVYRVRSSEYENSQGQTERLKYSEVGGYGPKMELKIGWQIK